MDDIKKPRGKKGAPKPKVSKAVLAAQEPEPEELQFTEEQLGPDDVPAVRRLAFNAQTVGGLAALAIVVILAAVVIGFRFVYAGKIYPGVSAEGVYLGGLTKDQAVTLLTKQAATLQNEQLAITYGNNRLTVPVNQLGATFDPNAAADNAFVYGRQGWCWDCILQKVRVLLGRSTVRTAVTIDNAKLTPFITPVADAAERPVANASFGYDGRVVVHPSQTGRRLDQGLLAMAILDRLNNGSTADITAPVYGLAPAVDDADLAAVEPQAAAYLSGPLQLQIGSGTRTVTQAQIAGWIGVDRPVSSAAAVIGLTGFYPPPPAVTLGLDQAAVAAYVADIASQTDQAPQDAELTIQNGQAVVFQPSHDGTQLDQAGAVKAIEAAVKSLSQRTVTLNVAVSKPAVNEADLNGLGINELISEGVTTFPGSSASRLQNIRVGASKFNGVLIKPSEEFSFDDHMGDVDAANGYAPSLVIIGNKIETQYGGGMCQVSTTAFRAALLAGLPITARTNHAYAISWYAWPYGVPGVDATVYGPTVDMRFINDTGHYILIQTIFDAVHSTLKFDFYGTRTKTGRINAPYFTSGSNDATQPSTTVFTRDVLDLAGNVIKTDTFTTHYESSLDFVHVADQLH